MRAMSATTTLLSVEEYAELPDEEWRKWELSDGELVPRYGDEMGARVNHNDVRGVAEYRLRHYFLQNKLGRVLAEQDFRLAEGVVRRPDVAVILKANSHILDDNPPIVPGCPDIAIEVVSPSNRTEDTERKIGQLLSAGAAEVWLLYLALRKAVVRTKDGLREVSEQGALEAPDLLPGFRLPLAELFDE